jgi:predicted DsbA family dithiol-disulfide isomerase
MSSHSEKITVDYFSDVLCVWAWIAQPRVEELQKQWGNRIEVRHRFVDVFGDARQKITSKYGEKNGYAMFHQHIVDAAANFDAVSIHADTWQSCRPRSSLQAHLVLKAVDLVGNEPQLETLALAIRRAFFEHGQDISDIERLLALARDNGLDEAALRRSLGDGSAMAALSGDQRMANNLGVKGSPTWILNEGRQMLYGNVGYRILSANIEELLSRGGGESSWC